MSGLSLLAVSSPVSYLVAFLVPAFDAILPILPSETAVIALGVATAGSADPRIAVLVAVAACGAFAGDNLAYLIGRRFGPAAQRRVFAGERGERRRAWAEHALDQFGARIIIVCRFLPGGRTAVTLTCGIVGYRRRAFIGATACAGTIWAAYAFFIGRLGGKAFEDRPWQRSCSLSEPHSSSASWRRCCAGPGPGAASAAQEPAASPARPGRVLPWPQTVLAPCAVRILAPVTGHADQLRQPHRVRPGPFSWPRPAT